MNPPALVEDYSYPGADRILAEKGIELKKGDGRILLADCDQAAQQIRVYTVGTPLPTARTCTASGPSGRPAKLTLELSRVFAVETADHSVRADLTANGETTSVLVDKNDWASVGEGTVGGAKSVLVELGLTG